MKRFLILSPFFYPEPIGAGKYNTYLADALASADVDVSIYCSHPLYPDWVVTPSDKKFGRVSIRRGGKHMQYPSNPLIRRLFLETWYFIFCALSLIRDRHFDVVIPIFPPSLFALLIPVLVPKKTRIVGMVHDLQGVYAERANGLTKSGLFSVISYIEKIAFRQCHHLIYLSEGMRKRANLHYKIDKEKTSVIYPFVTIDEFTDNGALSSVLPLDEKHLVYSGALGEKQAPKKLLEFIVEALENHVELQAHVFSQGPNFLRLQKSFKHDRLKFHPLVSEQNLPELLLRSHIQIIPQDESTSDGSLPSKLPNIMASRTRILCITDPDSELVGLMQEYPLGRACTEWSPAALQLALKQLLELDCKIDTIRLNQLLSRFRLTGLAENIIKHS